MQWSRLSPRPVGLTHDSETLSPLGNDASTPSRPPSRLGRCTLSCVCAGSRPAPDRLPTNHQLNLPASLHRRDRSSGSSSVHCPHSLPSLLWMFADTFLTCTSSSGSSLSFRLICPISLSIRPLGVLSYLRLHATPVKPLTTLCSALDPPSLSCSSSQQCCDSIRTDQKSWCHPSFLSFSHLLIQSISKPN